MSDPNNSTIHFCYIIMSLSCFATLSFNLKTKNSQMEFRVSNSEGSNFCFLGIAICEQGNIYVWYISYTW